MNPKRFFLVLILTALVLSIMIGMFEAGKGIGGLFLSRENRSTDGIRW